MRAFIHDLPKAELHLHIEGTLEPELMFDLARRNGVPLRYPTLDALRQAYRFSDLQSFLDIYYEGAAVLLKGEDFTDMALAYFRKAASQNVRHAEKPNKANRRADAKRTQKNREVLKQLAGK